MKQPYIIAGLLAVAATAWIGTGTFKTAGEGGSAVASTPPETPVEEVSAPSAADDLIPVRVTSLKAVSHVRRITILGRTEADRSVAVRAETAGRVDSVPVVKGQIVKAGDVIAQLAMDDRRSTVSAANAELERRQIAYRAAQKLSKKAFKSQVKLAEDKAALVQARSSLDSARLSVKRTTIRAPFDGVIEMLPAEKGDYLKVAGEVATIMDLDPIVIAVEVAERDLAAVQPGMKASVRMISGDEVTGTVRYLSKASDNTARTYRAEIAVENPNAMIAAGMTAEVILAVGEVTAHRVSSAVLTLNDAGVVGIKSVDEGGTVRFHKADLVDDTPDGIWLGNLPVDLQVITIGQEFVRPGQVVNPVDQSLISAN